MTTGTPIRLPMSYKRQQKVLMLIQIALPLFLCIISAAYELREHAQEVNEMGSFINGEVVVFGLIGPVAVAITIAIFRRMLAAQNAAQQQLEGMNAQLEQKVAERTEKLERQNEQLQKLDEMKSEFVAMVSHELRAPLTIMNGAMEMTLRDGNLPAPTHNTLSIMADESKRLTDFVQTILDLSRLDAGKLQVNFGPVAIRPLMEQAAGMILAQSKRPVIWDIANTLPPAWADEVLLEEALRNLIRNADKYSPPGKPITLSAKTNDKRQICMSVRDEGTGISESAQRTIFDRFTRGQTGESAPAGWGLGLNLARKLMEAQKGEIGLRSPVVPGAANPGSEFFVRVPVADMPDEEEK